MSFYLLDTNHASVSWRKPHIVAPRLRLLPEARFGLCVPSICELWYMVYNSTRVDSNSVELIEFLRDYELVDLDWAAAAEFGRIKADLRNAGKLIPDMDCQIGAAARVNDFVLLTADAHFSRVQDLRTENWMAAP